MNVTSLSETTYNVSTFILEKGLPFPRVVTQMRNVETKNNQSLQSENMITEKMAPLVYKLQANSTGVHVNCTFLDSSTTHCVAVVHQRISQLSSSGLMNIESSHMFARLGDIAYGRIKGINLEQYQVGVVGVRIISPTEKSDGKLWHCIYIKSGPYLLLL